MNDPANKIVNEKISFNMIEKDAQSVILMTDQS